MKKYNFTQHEIDVKVDGHTQRSSNRFILLDAILENIDLSNKSAPSGSCVRCVLENVNFINGNFPSNSFQYSDLTNVDFSGANLLCTNFRYTELKNVNFTGADLTGADFTGCETENVSFENCKISDRTILPSLRTEPVNLMKCTTKKALSLTKKIAKVALLVGSIGGIIGLCVYGLSQIWDRVIVFMTSCAKLLSDFVFLVASLLLTLISDILSVLVFVPWFVWVSIAVPMIIIGYSYVWCYRKNYPAKFERKLHSIQMMLSSPQFSAILIIAVVIVVSISTCYAINLFTPIF
ncbi:MAG: pentapeptide repeat-containing protein [Clostridia bacterium]|jgi:hypothetical protein|nr:pentapeptide repeat-containing protein [Clostridia bacterium]